MDGTRRPEPEHSSDLGTFEKSIVVAYSASKAVFPFFVFGGLTLAAAGLRAGAYLLIVGLVSIFAFRDLFMAMAMRRDGEFAVLTPAERVLLTLGFGCYLVAFVAAAAAVWGSRGAVYLAIGGVLASFLAHFVVAVSNYTRVMARPWPSVQPLGPEDDDDW